jgi:hypothetical protein
MHRPALASSLRLGTCALALLPLACGDDDGRASDPTGSPTPTLPTQPTLDPTPGSATGTEPGTGTDTDDPTGGTMSASQSGTDTDDPTAGPTSASATDSTTVDVTATDTDTTTTTDISASDPGETETVGPCAPATCSDDLQQVLCDGEVVQTCTNGTYCVDAECVAMTPCEAAELLKGSEGCEYWAVKSELIAEGDGSCFAAFVANTWDQPVHISVEYGGQQLPIANFARIPSGQGQNIVYQPYDANAGLPPNEVAILFLSRGPGGFPVCPAGPGVAQETHVYGTGFGQAFRISTDFPVAAYQMLPYGGGSVAATSATLLLPISVWDTNYIAVNAYQQGQAGQPVFSVVANEDGTQVTLDPKVAVVGGNGVQGGPAGVPLMYNLSRGQTIQFSQPQELTGSPLVANKRVGLFGGASCMNVPTNAYACDGAHQQIPPVKALGNAYAAVRYRNRTGQEESPPWRLVGAVDNTQLTYTPAKPNGAPDVLQLGQVAEFATSGPFLVQSQDLDHPFYLAAYMTGGDNYGGSGDPEWVNVIPTAQYLDEYVFFTDPTYPETNLVVVRNKKDGAFADVNLACAGALGGWQPLGADQEWTRVDLVTGNFQDQGNCSNGRQEISSANPFGVTVWGWGSAASQGFFSQYVSYAYPAGAAIKAINDVIVVPQ